MKNCFYFILLVISLPVNATDKDSTTYYGLPDSVKAVQFFAEINVKEINTPKKLLPVSKRIS